MIILLDTSTPECRLTIVDADTRVTHAWQADRTLAKGLLAYIRDTLTARSATVYDITAIGVFRGPGSFTGLRIGITVMNTLAHELHVPIIGALGDSWQDTALERITAGEDDEIILPEYGSDAMITTPKK